MTKILLDEGQDHDDEIIKGDGNLFFYSRARRALRV
jgi:hypothetical protein